MTYISYYHIIINSIIFATTTTKIIEILRSGQKTHTLLFLSEIINLPTYNKISIYIEIKFNGTKFIIQSINRLINQ